MPHDQPSPPVPQPARVQPLRYRDGDGARQEGQLFGREPGTKAAGVARSDAHDADRAAAAETQPQQRVRPYKAGGAAEQRRFAGSFGTQHRLPLGADELLYLNDKKLVVERAAGKAVSR